MIILFILCNILNLGAGIPEFGKDIPDVMYINQENVLPVVMHGCAAEDMLVKINTGSLYKKNDSTYAFIPQMEEEEVKIKLYYKKVIVEVRTVKTKQLPEGVPVFEKSPNSAISASYPQGVGSLILRYPEEVPVNFRPSISQFNVQAFNPQGGLVFSSTIRGNVFDNQTMEKIKKLTAGSKLSVNSIITQHPRLGNGRLNTFLELQVVP